MLSYQDFFRTVIIASVLFITMASNVDVDYPTDNQPMSAGSSRVLPCTKSINFFDVKYRCITELI